MQSKALRFLPKNLAVSSATGLAYTFYDYWQFNHEYPNSPVCKNTKLWQSLEQCRTDFKLPQHLDFATTNCRVLAASSTLPIPISSKIIISQNELDRLSYKTKLTTDDVTRAIIAHEAAHIQENHKFLTVSGSVLAHRVTYNLSFLLRYSSPVRHAVALLMFGATNLILAKTAEYRADYVAAQHGEDTRQNLSKIFQALSTSHSIFSAHPSSDKRLKNINPDQARANTSIRKG